MRSRPASLALVFLSSLLFVSCIDDEVQPTAPAASQAAQLADGMYDVGFTYYMLHDAARSDRPIPVYVWYPIDPASVTTTTTPAQYPLEPFLNILPVVPSTDFEDAGLGAAWQDVPAAPGPFPLIMFSPGLGAPAYASATYVATEIARHGFVVASMTHWGDCAAPVRVTGEPCLSIAATSYNRPRDVSFVLTDLLNRNAAASGLLSGSIDPAVIYASGWSLGGYTATVLAAGDDGVCDITGGSGPVCGPTDPDPRIKSIIPIDGSYQLMRFTELERVKVPSVAIGQEWLNAQSIMPAWQARAHAAFAGQQNYRVDVAGVYHTSFANFCETYDVLAANGITASWWPAWVYNMSCVMPTLTPAETHRIVNQYVLAFLTHQQSLLTPGFALVREPNVEFFVTERRSPSSIEVDRPDMFIYFMHQQGRGHGDELTAFAPKDPNGPPNSGYGIRNLDSRQD